MRLKPTILAAGFASLLLIAGSPSFAQTAAPTTTAPAAAAPATTAPAMTPVKPATAAKTAKPMAAGKATLSGPVNINSASADQLDALPQIGPKRAAKIIAGRPYKTIDDLVTKKVLHQKTFEKIKDKIIVS